MAKGFLIEPKRPIVFKGSAKVARWYESMEAGSRTRELNRVLEQFLDGGARQAFWYDKVEAGIREIQGRILEIEDKIYRDQKSAS